MYDVDEYLIGNDEADTILELLLQDAVDHNDQKAIKLLKSIHFYDEDGLPININWDVEIENIKTKIKR